MILDDEEDCCSLLKRIVDGLNHNAVVFTDPKEALDHAQTRHVDLVILDLELKDSSGIEVLEGLRAHNPQVNVLILTGRPTLLDRREALSMGVWNYMAKPIDIEILEKGITAALSANERSGLAG